VKIADDGQRNCPKHVEFYSKNKFVKLVHLVGFIICVVGTSHHGMARPQVVDRGTASDKEGSCEYIE